MDSQDEVKIEAFDSAKPTLYTVTAECINCGWYGSLSIPLGTLVSDAWCLVCGCKKTLLARKESL